MYYCRGQKSVLCREVGPFLRRVLYQKLHCIQKFNCSYIRDFGIRKSTIVSFHCNRNFQHLSFHKS